MKNQNIWIFLFLLSGFLVKDSNAGKYAADFLRIGVGARAAAMGGAFTAFANDASAFYWNPAGLVQIPRFAIHVDHVAMFGDLAQYNVANGTFALGNNLALGISWIRLGVDEIPRYAPLKGTRFERLTTGENRSTGQAIDYFADNEDAVFISLAKNIKFDLGIGRGFSQIIIPVEFSFGLSGKFIQHKLDDKMGTGQGVDAGLLLRFLGKRKQAQQRSWLGFGIVGKDLSRTGIVWNTDSHHQDHVETSLVLGAAYSKYFSSFKSRCTLSVDKEMGDYENLYMGGELEFSQVIGLRAGLAGKKITVGAGLILKWFRIDYAFLTHDLANTHRVSGSFYF